VNNPTLIPNLYEPISVKKKRGSRIFPPLGIVWHKYGNKILPAENKRTKV
jgi:hypothetical protein